MRTAFLTLLVFAAPAFAQVNFDVATGRGVISATLPAGATIQVVEVSNYTGKAPLIVGGVVVDASSPVTGSGQVNKGVNYTVVGGTVTFTGYTGVDTTVIAAPTTWTKIERTGVTYIVTVFLGGKFDRVIYNGKLGN